MSSYGPPSNGDIESSISQLGNQLTSMQGDIEKMQQQFAQNLAYVEQTLSAQINLARIESMRDVQAERISRMQADMQGFDNHRPVVT